MTGGVEIGVKVRLFPFSSGAADRTAAESDMSLFSGLGTDVHFTGEESGMQWRNYVFELQTATE